MTMVDLATSTTPLREIIEVWAKDRRPPQLRDFDGRLTPLRDYLAEGDGVPEIRSQLDGSSTNALEEIVSESDFESFDGSEQHAADLLLIALTEHESDRSAR